MPIEVLELLSRNKKLYNVIIQNYPSLLSSRSSSLDNILSTKNEPQQRMPVTFNMKLKKEEKNDTAKPRPVHQVNIPKLYIKKAFLKILIFCQ